MRKILLFALTAVLTTSCIEDAEYHQIYVGGKNGSNFLVYADQTADTLYIQTYDSWRASYEATWLTLSHKSEEITDGAFHTCIVPMTFQLNDTGVGRHAKVHIDSYYVAQADVYQYPWLNVIKPAGVSPTGQSADFEKYHVTFQKELKANQTSTPVEFTLYQDGGTIYDDADWLTLSSEEVGKAGTYRLVATLTPNTTGAARTATIRLTSAGITTPIIITQTAEQ